MPLEATAKWDVESDVIGVGIAESDFGAPEFIRESLAEYVRGGSLGYLWRDPRGSMVDAFVDCYAALSSTQLEVEDVRLTADVLAAFDTAMRALTNDGAVVLVPIPSYPPFLDIPERFGRQLVESPMQQLSDGRWALDLDHIDEVASKRPGGLLVLCNPHNPTGSLASLEELQALSELMDRHGWHVFADEIHAPVVHGELQMHPYAQVSAAARAHTITATSASKGWNLAGLKCAQVIVGDPMLRKIWDAHIISPHSGPSIVGVVASILAYSRAGRDWLNGTNARHRSALAHLEGLLAEQLPLTAWKMPDATYLAWVDLGSYLGDQPSLDELADSARINWLDGSSCGASFAHWVRLNCATDTKDLDRLVARLADSISQLND